MRLFVINQLGEKIILDVTAPTRFELALKIGKAFSVNGEDYHIKDVRAEQSNNDTTGGLIIGGLLGILGGGLGVVIGGVAGTLIGGIRDNDEQKAVDNFNNSLS
jgi:uncharacterized protein YcfJ